MTELESETQTATTSFVLGCLLAVMMTLCGCDTGPAPGSYEALQQQREDAETTLSEQGAKLEKKAYPVGEGWVVDLSGQQLDDQTFEALQELGKIAELNLSATNLSDAHAPHLAEISDVLLKIDLSDTDVGDAALTAIGKSLFLSEVNVTDTRVTEEGVAELQKTRRQDTRLRPAFKKVQVTR